MCFTCNILSIEYTDYSRVMMREFKVRLGIEPRTSSKTVLPM